MRIVKPLSIIQVRLKKGVENHDQFKPSNEYGGNLGRISLSRFGTDDRFTFLHENCATPTDLPEILTDLVDEVFWQEQLEGAFPLPQGIHKYQNGEMIITSHYGSTNAYWISISAKDLPSLFEIYTKLFPWTVLPEFTAK